VHVAAADKVGAAAAKAASRMLSERIVEFDCVGDEMLNVGEKLA
jgi:hypothetical protein